VTNVRGGPGSSNITVPKRKRYCTQAEAEAKKKESAKRKRLRVERQEAIRQADSRRKADQQQIMEDVKRMYSIARVP
jgi:hypothetical protein